MRSFHSEGPNSRLSTLRLKRRFPQMSPPPRSLRLVIGAFPIETHQSTTNGHRRGRGGCSPVRTATVPQAKTAALTPCGVVRGAGRVRAVVQCGMSVVVGFALLGGAAATPSGSEGLSAFVVLSSLSGAAAPAGDGDSRPAEERSRSSPSRTMAKACSGKGRGRRIAEGEASHPPNGQASPHSSDSWPSAPADASSLLPHGWDRQATGSTQSEPARAPAPGPLWRARWRAGAMRR
jgi:hypothetical protein